MMQNKGRGSSCHMNSSRTSSQDDWFNTFHLFGVYSNRVSNIFYSINLIITNKLNEFQTVGLDDGFAWNHQRISGYLNSDKKRQGWGSVFDANDNSRYSVSSCHISWRPTGVYHCSKW